MIGRLTGTVVSEEIDGRVVLDVSGVGYEVMTPIGTAARLGVGGQTVTLLVHTHVREDTLDLFGFATEVEKRVFRLLIGVPNVGPGLALRLLSTMSVEDMARAVKSDDTAGLNKVKGIGKRTAERLVLELREKLPKIATESGMANVEGAPKTAAAPDNAARLTGALTHMGYRPSDAERAVKSLGDRVDDEPVSSLLKDALAALAQ